MPIFDMRCSNKDCKYTGEHLLKSHKQKVNCPECGNPLEKGISTFNIGRPNSDGSREKTRTRDVYSLTNSAYLPNGDGGYFYAHIFEQVPNKAPAQSLN